MSVEILESFSLEDVEFSVLDSPKEKSTGEPAPEPKRQDPCERRYQNAYYCLYHNIRDVIRCIEGAEQTIDPRVIRSLLDDALEKAVHAAMPR